MLTRFIRSPLIPIFLLNVASGQSPKVGETAPPLSVERTIPAGVGASWEALQGKPVVIEFWATWCGNCVAEIPRLNELARKFSGVQFLSITDEQLSVVEPFLSKRPVFGWVGLDRAGTTFKANGVEGRPRTMLVDKDGILRGIMHPAQVTKAVLADFVAGRPVAPGGLKAHLRIFGDSGPAPVFAVVLRPSSRAKGGNFNISPGALQGDSLALKTIIAYAYSISERRLEGPVGMPERMRTDNGAPFASNGDTGLSALAVWWIKLGIRPERIRPGKPQENGRHERMHLTLKQATASPPAGSWREQQRRFDRFRREYSQERPHEALGQVPPAEFYQPSGREWPRKLPEVSYGKDVEQRRVEAGGQIRWRGQRVFVSHALAGEPVGLEQVGPEAWRVNFSFYFLGVAQGQRTRLWTPEQWRRREEAENS